VSQRAATTAAVARAHGREKGKAFASVGSRRRQLVPRRVVL
jgi:hypothetical protein